MRLLSTVSVIGATGAFVEGVMEIHGIASAVKPTNADSRLCFAENLVYGHFVELSFGIMMLNSRPLESACQAILGRIFC